MCYGMNCPYENRMGECTFTSHQPYPCEGEETKNEPTIEEMEFDLAYDGWREDQILTKEKSNGS